MILPASALSASPPSVPHLMASTSREHQPGLQRAPMSLNPSAVHAPGRGLDLPLEIAELIIDQVADAHTLRSIARVCHAYLHRCRTRLFHTIDLGDRFLTGQEYYRRLSRAVFRTFPGLRAYVRELRLVDTAPFGSADFMRAAPAWIAEEESIAEVLALLPHLRVFGLALNKNALVGSVPPPAGHPGVLARGLTDWGSLRPGIRSAILELVKRPLMQRLSLAHMRGFPPQLLVSLMRVPQLELIDVRLRAETTLLGVVPAVAAITPPRLESLTLRSPAHNIIQVLNDVLAQHRSSLKALTVVGLDVSDEPTVDRIWHLLRLVSGTLEDFDWRPTTRNMDIALSPPRPIHLGVLSGLSDFRFVVNFHATAGAPRVFEQLLIVLQQLASLSYTPTNPTPIHGATEPVVPPSHINTFISHPPPYDSFSPAAHTKLQTLTVEVMFMHSLQLVGTSREWSALDAFLSGGEFDAGEEDVPGTGRANTSYIQKSFRFPALREVAFTSRRRSSPEMKARAREILSEQLPRCRGRGIEIVFEGDLC